MAQSSALRNGAHAACGVAIDTCRNIIENIYFGAFFGSQYGLFPGQIAQVLGDPILLILPKLLNIVAGCAVLGPLLMHWLPEVIRERSRSEQDRADLALLATEDALTGVFNRRHFDDVARSEWARFQRYGRPLSLLALDVDKFKSINDTYGHAAGDLVLKSIAQTCSAARRQTDILARIGGEEFVLLLPETDETAATVLAERFRKQIASMTHMLGDEKVRVTDQHRRGRGHAQLSSFDVLLKRADEAMYRAKAGGRDRVERAPCESGSVYRMAAE